MGKYKISDAEWEIMKVIWQYDTISANQIIEVLGSNTIWSPKTIKTMLNRLITKEVIGYHKEGRSYLYYARLTSEQTISDENVSFLSKVHNGNFSSMLASFVGQNEFSEEEIEALKKILEGKEND